MLSHSLSFKWMQTCLQRFICSEEDAETAILKLFKQCIITVKRLLRIICKHLNYLLNLMCNWVTCNENFRFPRENVHVSKERCTCKQKKCIDRCSLNQSLTYTLRMMLWKKKCQQQKNTLKCCKMCKTRWRNDDKTWLMLRQSTIIENISLNSLMSMI